MPSMADYTYHLCIMHFFWEDLYHFTKTYARLKSCLLFIACSGFIKQVDIVEKLARTWRLSECTLFQVTHCLCWSGIDGFEIHWALVCFTNHWRAEPRLTLNKRTSRFFVFFPCLRERWSHLYLCVCFQSCAGACGPSCSGPTCWPPASHWTAGRSRAASPAAPPSPRRNF